MLKNFMKQFSHPISYESVQPNKSEQYFKEDREKLTFDNDRNGKILQQLQNNNLNSQLEYQKPTHLGRQNNFSQQFALIESNKGIHADEIHKKQQKIYQCNKENAYIHPQQIRNIVRKDIKHATQPNISIQEKQHACQAKIEQERKNGKQLFDANQQILRTKLIELYARDIQKNLIRENEQNNCKIQCLKNHTLTPHLRAKMVDWMIEVLNSYKCCDQSFFLSVCLMDQFFKNSQRQQTPNDLHLIGVVCMFIACKYEEIYPFKLSTVYEKIAHKKLSQEQIKLKEGEILQSINFNICISTPYEFLTLLIAEFKLNEIELIGERFQKYCVYLAKKLMHCYEVLNCDSFLNISLATILVVIDQLISSNDEEISQQFKEKRAQIVNNFKLDSFGEGFEDTMNEVRILSKQFSKMFPSFENLKKFCGVNELFN